MKKSLKRAFPFVLSLALALGAVSAAAWSADKSPAQASPPAWEYNHAPDPATPMGRELIDIAAGLPEYKNISAAIMDDQKFRYAFGAMLTRAHFEPNSVKILFEGQDATHFAEAAKQPGTSGFGGRVQDVGHFFGVDQGVATTNTFASTIKGQYGAFSVPIVEIGKDGKPAVHPWSFVDNQLWTITNSPNSQILKMREAYFEWLIRNNPDSLRLFVVFGGAARDSFGQFLVNRGAKVATKVSDDRLKNMRVPETKLVFAGGNNEFSVPVDKDGNDIYQILLGGKKLDYSKPEVQEQAAKALADSGQKGIDLMVFTHGGVHGSGVVNAAQIGGYDLDHVEINGVRTNSLKGLKLSDGTIIDHDIGFTMSPHPTALSMMKPDEAAAALKKAFARLNDLKAKGWAIEPDLDPSGKPMRNAWASGDDYKYGRADLRPSYFEFGAPDDRRGAHADASRLDTQTIIVGTRDRVKFDQAAIDAMRKAQPSSPKDPRENWAVHPRLPETRAVFDRGPGDEIAQLLYGNLDRDTIFATKPGMTLEKNGIDAFNTKSGPGSGFFGPYRGRIQGGARAFILADPHGIDDWNTSFALTGARGQYLNGLMEDLGVGDQYLVLKTVPFGMDGATPQEWETIRAQTEKYREAALAKFLADPKNEVIFTDGDIARAEMDRILKKLGISGKTVINITRQGMDASSGIAEAGALARKLPQFSNATIHARMADIPRTHLSWWNRIWEGTSGDRVIDAPGKYRGIARALNVPDWVFKQEVPSAPATVQSISAMHAELESAGVRLAHEDFAAFLKRRVALDGNFDPSWKGGEVSVSTPKLAAAPEDRAPAAGCGFDKLAR